MQSEDPSRGDWFPDDETVISIAPGANVFREPTKEPVMNPEVHSPWDDSNKVQDEPSSIRKQILASEKAESDFYSQSENKDEVSDIEKEMIQATLGIISMNSLLTIRFLEHGSNVFMDKELAGELINILKESNTLMGFVMNQMEKVHEVHS